MGTLAPWDQESLSAYSCTHSAQGRAPACCLPKPRPLPRIPAHQRLPVIGEEILVLCRGEVWEVSMGVLSHFCRTLSRNRALSCSVWDQGSEVS